MLGGVGTLAVIGIWAWAFPNCAMPTRSQTELRTGNQEPGTGLENQFSVLSFEKDCGFLSFFCSESPSSPNSYCRSGHRLAPRPHARSDSSGRRHRHLKVITRGFRIRQLAHWFHILPVGGVHGVFCALDVRKSVCGAEAHMDLRPSTEALSSSIRGGVVSTSKRVLSRVEVSACPGECEGPSDASISMV